MADPVAPRRRGRKPPGAAIFAGGVDTAPVTPEAVIAALKAPAPALASPAAFVAVAEPAPEPLASLPEPAAETVAETVQADPAPLAADPAPLASADAPEPAAPEIPDPVIAPFSEGPIPMATTYDTAATADVADKAKLMFGDINDRAKTAVEKSVKLGEELTEFTKGNVEAIVASGRVAAKGAETLAQDVAETVKKNFETTTAQFKSFASVKSPTELFQLQSDYAKSYFDGAVADASKFSESVFKLWGDIAQPLSSRYALAAEKFKATSAF